MISFFRKLTWLARRRRKESELDEEIRFHLEEEAEERRAEGLSSEEARRAAVRDFGNTASIAEATRSVWGWLWLDQLRQDLTYGVRTLWRAPGFTLAAVVVLALGMGANLAPLHILNASMFHRLSIRDADSLVGFAPAQSFPAVQFYSDNNSVFSYVVAELNEGVFVEDGLRTKTTTFVSGAYFTNLGVTPAEGRLLDAHDAEAGAPPAAVLSYSYWQQHYGGDRQAVGRVIHLNEKPVQVVGVAPSDFNGLSEVRPSIFLPIATQPYLFDGSKVLGDFSLRGTMMWAKLKPGVGSAAAVAQLSSLSAELQRQHPDQIGPRESPIVRRPLPGEAGFALVLITLLIWLVAAAACANLGNLLLARGQLRQREIGIRLGLGAGAGRIVRQLMVENFLLAALGAGAGLVLAYFTAKGLLLADGAPPEMHVVTDWWILFAGVVLAFLSALVFGLAPALQAVRKSKLTRARRVLVGVQVTAGCFLLIITSFLVRSTQQSLAIDVRFDYRHMIVIDPQLYAHNLSSAAALRTLDNIAARLQEHPAVAGVTLSASPPPGHSLPANVPGLPPMNYYQVSQSYFALMNLPLVRGRLFADNENYVVLSESAARAIWPNEDPLGKTIAVIRFGSIRGDRNGRGFGLIDRRLDERTVIGIVKDSRAPGPGAAEAYLAIGGANVSSGTIIVQTRKQVDPGDVIKELRSVAALPGILPAAWLMRTDFEEDAGPPRAVLLGVGSLGAIATLLSGFGIFGLIAFAVAQRTREIGVRLALGARPSNIIGTVAVQYAGAISIGIGAGIALAIIVGLLIRNQFVGLRTQDPISYAAGVIVLVAVALIAIVVPAARALRIDPASALRRE